MAFASGTAPVREGETLDVRVESVGSKGDGMARFKGFVLFVPDTKVGDEVQVRVTKVLDKSGFAEVVGPAQKSTRREKPKEPEEPEYDDSQDTEDFGEEEGK